MILKKIICLVSVSLFLMTGLGYAQLEQDYQNDREKYIAFIKDESTTPEMKAKAQSLLAEMNYLGLGLQAPDYLAAREGYTTIINNKFAPENIKASAQYQIASMDFLGNGLEKPDYKSARKGFTCVLNNKDAEPNDKERAKEMLNKIDRFENESEAFNQPGFIQNLQNMLYNFVYASDPHEHQNNQQQTNPLLEKETKKFQDYHKKANGLSSLPAVHKKALEELQRFEIAHIGSSEYIEVRNYLDCLFSIPFLKIDTTEVDLKKSEILLDRDHYGLSKVKDQILDYLALQKRVPEGKSPILCIVGPPGVGKTTLTISIAEAMNRKFIRVPLGGVSDEGTIRGFLRAYVSARPGNIVRALMDADTSNPVILLDEIDKLSKNSQHGDPAAALLEVLDPAQNNSFKDHYLEIGVDLSKVTFIATANSLEDIPPALRDRLEIVELSSYTAQEKVAIAKQYLVPKQLKDTGLKVTDFSITEEAIYDLITKYTVEAGVRQLDRTIGTLCRKVNRGFYDGKSEYIVITPEILIKYLGQPKVEEKRAFKENSVGKVMGLYKSSIGGGIQPIETVILQGRGGITMTGNLGTVSNESIKVALSVVKAMLPKYNVDPQVLDKKDIHVHLSTATPKDGPSAGIAIATSVISAITKIPTNKNVCMTGEISLQGEVMQIGGLKDKLIAAHSAGLKIAVIPYSNASDLDDIPQQVKEGMKIFPVKHISQVLEIALVRK